MNDDTIVLEDLENYWFESPEWEEEYHASLEDLESWEWEEVTQVAKPANMAGQPGLENFQRGREPLLRLSLIKKIIQDLLKFSLDTGG